MQAEVYRTVGLRSQDSCDATWAPWWRAQAHAIHHVAMLREPNAEKGAKWLARELAFAAKLAAKSANNPESPDGSEG
jgi:hypothetical protein